LQQVLFTVSPNTSEWEVIATCSLVPVAIIELVKTVQRRLSPIQARSTPR
jgi:hypothetical protein